MSFSQIVIIGHLGADPDLRYTKNQNPVVNMSIGVSENLPMSAPKDKKPKTYWHKTRRWGLQAENHSTQLKKGDKVFIKGTLVYDVWEDKSGFKHKDAIIEIEHLEKMYYENVTIDMNSL
jgi:single-strand DNA-binding protein